MMDLKKARAYAHELHLATRKVFNMVHSERMEEVFEGIDELDHEEKYKVLEECRQLVVQGRYEALRFWMTRYSDRDIEELNVSELRQLAQQERLAGYQSASKTDLLRMINDARQRKRDDKKGNQLHRTDPSSDGEVDA